MRKNTNLILLIVLVVLGIVYALTKIFELSGKDSTMPAEAFKADTSEVTEIHLYSGAKDKNSTTLTRQNNEWVVKSGDKTAPAKPSAVEQLKATLAGINVESLVSKSEDDFSEYKVGDSAAVRVVARKKESKLLDLFVGRFEPDKQRRRSMGRRRRRLTGETYVRLNNRNEIYSVNGLLNMKLNRKFNDLRDNRLLNLDKQKVASISFKYPADSSFTMKNESGNWLAGTLKADSAKTAKYLSNMENLTYHRFNDKFEPSGSPDYEVIFEGKTMSPVALKGYKQDGNIIVLNSSQNPDTYFSATMKDVAGKALKPKDYFFNP